MSRQIFVNLPVKDLQKTIKFFTALGFTFNQQFTDENATCMVVSDSIYCMLLTEKMFKTFTKKNIVDTKKDVEVLLAIKLENREEVDAMVTKAVAAGGKIARDTEDHGWMYARSFEDLDGHTWEPFTMDESKMPKKE